VNCKICDSAQAALLFTLASGAVRVRRCGECSFTFVDHVVEEHKLESSVHGIEGVPDADPISATKWQRRMQVYQRACGSLRGKRILDVGAGGGGWLALAKAAGAEVHGIEFCGVCRDFARTRFQLELNDQPLESSHWTAQRHSYDLVSFWDVLEHVNSPRRFLQDSLALLAPGGKLMFSTPVRDTWFDRAGVFAYRLSGGRHDFLLRQRYSHAHLQIFHSRQLRELCTSQGMRALYYRKIFELTFPVKRYLRNIYGESLMVNVAAWIANAALTIAPVSNKVLAIFERN